MLVVVALLVTRLFAMFRQSERFGPVDVAWVLPVVAYTSWEVFVRFSYGHFPALAESGNTSFPLVGVIDGVRMWLEHPHRDELFQLVQLLVLLTVIVLALLNLKRSEASAFERLSFLFALILTVLLSTSIWNNDPREFRTMVEVFVLGSGVLLGTRSFRPLVVLCMTWGVWVLAAGLSLKSA